MATWGPELYNNDISLDIKSEYIDFLHRGFDDDEIVRHLEDQFSYMIHDDDDGIYFWITIADLQWKYGRVNSEIKEKALNCISYIEKTASQEQDNYTKKLIERLRKVRDRISSPAPKYKQVKPYSLYHCEWKNGDLYALPLDSITDIEEKYKDFSVLLYKVDDDHWWPGHLIPVVWFKMAETRSLPSNLDEYNAISYIKISYRLYEERLFGITLPEDPVVAEATYKKLLNKRFEVDENGNLPIYRGEMICTSKRSIPKNLIYLGNYPSVIPPENEYIPYGEHWSHGKKYNSGLYSIKWKDIVNAVCKKAIL